MPITAGTNAPQPTPDGGAALPRDHHSGPGNRLRRLDKALRKSLCALGLLIVVVTFTPLTRWWARSLSGQWETPSGDVLIVLAGASGDNDIVGWNSLLRAKFAAGAYRSGTFRNVVITGGTESFPTAERMADYLRALGVPTASIVVDNDSRSTRENATACRRLLGEPSRFSGRRVLLTSDYHMFRAKRVFHKVGIEVAPYPIPDVTKRSSTWRGRYPAFLDLCLETTKIVYYLARGWM